MRKMWFFKFQTLDLILYILYVCAYISLLDIDSGAKNLNFKTFKLQDFKMYSFENTK